MKIAFLGDIRSIHVHKFINWFAAKGNKCILISLDYPQDPRQETGLSIMEPILQDVHLIAKNPLFLASLETKKIIRRFNPDIVQCHFITNYGALGAYADKHPLVMTAMGDDVLIHPNEFLYGRLVQFALGKADMVTADGFNSLEAATNLGVPKEKQMLVYPGIDMDLFNPDKREPQPHPIVLCPRGFDGVYDPQTLLRVIHKVQIAIPETVFVCAGGGTEFEWFKSKTEHNGNVKLVGNVDNSYMPYLFSSADVSLNTSISDGGIPTSTIEAMACGCPVVSTDAGDARYWIERNAAGHICSISDADKLAKAVLHVLQHPEHRDRLGRNGRAGISRMWDYNMNMQKIENMYTNLIS